MQNVANKVGRGRRLTTLAAAAMLVGAAACSSDDGSEASPQTTLDPADRDGDGVVETTTTQPSAECEPIADSISGPITAALVGEPAPTIANAQTAEFTVGGDFGRIVVVEFAGPGLDGTQAVFVVGPSGTIYAEDAFAQEFSTLEPLDLNTEWDEPIATVRACL